MRIILAFLIIACPSIVTAQTHPTEQQKGNVGNSGSYVAPAAIPKTYTPAPTYKAPEPSTKTSSNAAGIKSSSPVQSTENNAAANTEFRTVYPTEDKNGYRVAVNFEGKRGFIDADYKIVIPFIYDDAMVSNSGYYGVQKGSKWGFVDKHGIPVISFKYDRIVKNFSRDSDFDNAIVTKNGKEVIISRKVDLVQDNSDLTNRYNNVGDFYDGFAVVSLAYKYGYINEDKIEVIPLKFNYANDFSESMAGVSIATTTKKFEYISKWGFIDKTGNVVIPIIYDQLYRGFREGYAAVRLNGKWGFIDKTGKTIIPFIYDEVLSFKEGLACARLKKKWGFIDPEGKTAIPFQYDESTYFMGNGKAEVILNGKKIYIDKAGNEVSP